MITVKNFVQDMRHTLINSVTLIKISVEELKKDESLKNNSHMNDICDQLNELIHKIDQITRME